MALTIFCLIMAYLLGSVSTSIIVCRISGIQDPRTVGSKNPGTTNMLRIAGKKLAIITLIGDILKGFLAVIIASILGLSSYSLGLAALAVFLGHIFPIFFEFKGGKGVATGLGAFFALSPLLGLLVSATWLITAFLFRYSSLAALTAYALAPLYAFLFSSHAYSLTILLMTILLFYRHRNNIERLRAGTEKKIGRREK